MNHVVKRKETKKQICFETLYLELVEGCTLSPRSSSLPISMPFAIHLCSSLHQIYSVFFSLPLELALGLDLLWPSE